MSQIVYPCPGRKMRTFKRLLPRTIPQVVYVDGRASAGREYPFALLRVLPEGFGCHPG
jgi:hypothetical protein